MLSGFFGKLYALPYMEVIGVEGLFSLSVLWLKLKYGRKLRPVWGGMLLFWGCAVLYLTIWSRSGSSPYRIAWLPFHSYREMLQTGNREILRSSFMNVALFYPAGLLTASLLSEQWPRRRKLMVTAIVFALFSLAIECTQSFCALGRPEIDDVLHNTLGAVCGAAPIILRDPCSRSSEGAPTGPAR